MSAFLAGALKGFVAAYCSDASEEDVSLPSDLYTHTLRWH